MARYMVFHICCLLLAGNLFSQKKDTAKYVLYDEQGKSISLEKYKGKVVYIDFWASWCGPCKGYMDLSKELHAKFTKKQQKKIVFLYVSIDSDTAVWHRAIRQASVKSVHVLSPGTSDNSLGYFFGMTGLPRFVILDKKGRVASLIAKTPYQKEVYDELLALIEQ